MKASIITPSYNASERLYMNLISLNHQDYPLEDFEVIVIDNGSSDTTSTMLSNFEAKFPLKTVRIEKNRGIAHGRNMGVLEASGDILIFHDSDMIASKDFVRKHIEAHKEENIVVCGLPWLRIYSHFYSSFAPYQIEDLIRKIGCYNLSTDNLQKDKHPLITEAQIAEGSFLKLSFDLGGDFIASLKDTLIAFDGDLKEYQLPWRFFITNNASADRKKVIDAGMFDENIVKYGFEDYDLGIRLYKAGGQFKLLYDILSVHQEHARHATTEDVKENLNYMCMKYNNIYFIDMLLLCLGMVVATDHKIINSVMCDINRMHSIGQYTEILNTFVKILQTAIKLCLNQDMNLKLITKAGITRNILSIKNELKDLRETHGMVHFPGIFSALAKSIFDLDL